MSNRTTLFLDEEARDDVVGVPLEKRKERSQILEQLIKLFEGHAAEEEIRQLKEQDEGF